MMLLLLSFAIIPHQVSTIYTGDKLLRLLYGVVSHRESLFNTCNKKFTYICAPPTISTPKMPEAFKQATFNGLWQLSTSYIIIVLVANGPHDEGQLFLGGPSLEFWCFKKRGFYLPRHICWPYFFHLATNASHEQLNQNIKPYSKNNCHIVISQQKNYFNSFNTQATSKGSLPSAKLCRRILTCPNGGIFGGPIFQRLLKPRMLVGSHHHYCPTSLFYTKEKDLQGKRLDWWPGRWCLFCSIKYHMLYPYDIQ